jgi:hypothetical protein
MCDKQDTVHCKYKSKMRVTMIYSMIFLDTYIYIYIYIYIYTLVGILKNYHKL